jgi:hypothetical protein
MSFAVASEVGVMGVGGPSGQSLKVRGSAAWREKADNRTERAMAAGFMSRRIGMYRNDHAWFVGLPLVGVKPSGDQCVLQHAVT